MPVSISCMCFTCFCLILFTVYCARRSKKVSAAPHNSQKALPDGRFLILTYFTFLCTPDTAPGSAALSAIVVIFHSSLVHCENRKCQKIVSPCISRQLWHKKQCRKPPLPQCNIAQKRNVSFDDFLSDRLEPSFDPLHAISTTASTNSIQHSCAVERIFYHSRCHVRRSTISRPHASNNWIDEHHFECDEDSSSADQSSIDTWEMEYWIFYKWPADGFNSGVFVCMQRYFGGDGRHLAAVYRNYQTHSPDFCLTFSESCCLSCEIIERAHSVRPKALLRFSLLVLVLYLALMRIFCCTFYMIYARM